MPKAKVNDIEIDFENGMTVLQVCELAGAEIPRFCYHERLSIAGNCRMCLVEIKKSPKPVASCAMPASEGMEIKTNTSFVDKARKGVMEFLLANHPLDCPVCDQGGECDLQDQSMFYGFDRSRYKENKRQVPEKYMGPLIKTQMTRCIHCTRCIRFATEIAGVTELGAIGRGENMEITTYLEKSMDSELSANVIDLCPVGALTSKPYAFEARPWELKKTETIDVMDSVGSNIRVDTYGWEVKRVLPRINENINEEWISDKTRYACDGLLKQRLDTPYIRENGKLKKTNWDIAYKTIIDKLKNLAPDYLAGHVGDMVNFETIFYFKEFFKKSLGSNNLEFRNEPFYLNPDEKKNYLFNSSINGIEKSDLVLLVGTDLRYEATMINARIRKAYLKNNLEIFSIGNCGDLTYPYKNLGESTEVILDLINKKSEFYEKFIKSKKPIVIIGQSALKPNIGKFIFEGLKRFLYENNFINKDWNSLNVLLQNASDVGSVDLRCYMISEKNNFEFFEKQKNGYFKFLYLLGSDNFIFEKKDQFIVYQGSHGDKGAEIADVILPGATYTEQNGIYLNTEGRVQRSFKASYPPGDAKEDFKILLGLSKKLNKPLPFYDSEKLLNLVTKKIKFFKNFDDLPKLEEEDIKTKDFKFQDEKIEIKKINYYLSNSISRASKTMNECKQIKEKQLIEKIDG